MTTYATCSLCCESFPTDDLIEYEGRLLCRCCYEEQTCTDHTIHEYYYKPSPIFFGEGLRYFGVELEVDAGGENDDNAAQIVDIANIRDERIYCKHDGSLDDGFEIVTHPMTLTYHQQNLPWSDILYELHELGYLSHQACTCGLHVHVNRDSLGETEYEQDSCIARILYFFEKHWDELLKFSRRTNRQLDRWAARYGYKEQPMDILDHAKNGGSRGRYTCVNLQTALKRLPFKLSKSMRINLDCGEILQIDQAGQQTVEPFTFTTARWDYLWDYPAVPAKNTGTHAKQARESYLNDLKLVASCYGYTPQYVDYLLEEGFDFDSIEDILFNEQY